MPMDLTQILSVAPETKTLELEPKSLGKVCSVFQKHFAGQVPLVVADPTTFEIAGQKVMDLLRESGQAVPQVFLFGEPTFYAASEFVSRLQDKLRQNPGAIPVAVGSGTINDVSKLAAQRTNRRYMAVATAASMDGYAAFGASITDQGSKQTFGCAAPLAIVADSEICARAPANLNAAGYADLLAKVTAGADWILADGLGVESIQGPAWDVVQKQLRESLAQPEGIPKGERSAIESLLKGLLWSGFAMQLAASSRPASGAEHQFSHLWDMEHHTFRGAAPLHGFKVGVATLAVTGLYEFLLQQPLENLDVSRCCDSWPTLAQQEEQIRKEFTDPALVGVGLAESRLKYVPPTELRGQLEILRRTWPELRRKIEKQLLPLEEVKRNLRQAGAPVEPEQIGLTRERLRRGFRSAYFIRRRFTVLDLAVRVMALEPALDQLFGPEGPWPV
jgi:glycerol-1-phosphate dehydrogenase [NAD(P)+]